MKLPKLITDISLSFDERQRLFLSNIFSIGGGAVLFTWWQIQVPLSKDVPEYSSVTQAVIIAVALAMFVLAVYLQEKK